MQQQSKLFGLAKEYQSVELGPVPIVILSVSERVVKARTVTDGEH
jgi:hypothetical protein